MKNFLLLFLFIFILTAGIASGVAYERYVHREECLKIAFDSNSQETLSDNEITEILKTLNDDNNNGNSDAGVNLDATQESEKQENSNDNINRQKKNYVGSRNSNKFYSVDCRYAKLIKEENKVYFDSVEDGEKQGRTYANCK